MLRSDSLRQAVDRRLGASRPRVRSIGPGRMEGPPSRTVVESSSKIRRSPPEMTTTTSSVGDSLLPPIDQIPIQAYWAHIAALQGQISKIETQCAQLNASLEAWKSFLAAVAADDPDPPEPDEPKRDAMPSNLPACAKQSSELPPVQRRKSRALVPPVAPSHSRSQSRSNYTMPWRQESQDEEWPNESISDRRKKAEETSSENLTGTNLTRWHLMQVKRLLDEPSGAKYDQPSKYDQQPPVPSKYDQGNKYDQQPPNKYDQQPPNKYDQGPSNKYDQGPSNKYEQASSQASKYDQGPHVASKYDQAVSHSQGGGGSHTQPGGVSHTQGSSSAKYDDTKTYPVTASKYDQPVVTGKSDPLASPPPASDIPRPSRRLRRQQTTSIEFTDDKVSARSKPGEDKENAPIEAPASPPSETDGSVFSGYFPITQHSSSVKPSCVPALGLEPTRLPPSAWLSGEATQGDTYGA